MLQFIGIAIIIGVPFSIIAGFISGLIVYEEFLHHFTDKRRALRPAVETGVFVFILFISLAILIAIILPKTI